MRLHRQDLLANLGLALAGIDRSFEPLIGGFRELQIHAIAFWQPSPILPHGMPLGMHLHDPIIDAPHQ
jgi:hypothetical protein